MMLDEAGKVRQVIALEEDTYPVIERCINAVLSAFIDRLQKEPELLDADDLFSRYRPDPDEGLCRATYELLMKAWLLGMVHASRKRPADFADIDYSFLDGGMTFDEAIAWAKGRVTLAPAQFSKLSAQMKVHAFTVGRLTQLDMVEKAKGLYLKQLESSEASMQQFVSDIRADVDAVGLPGYYEMVYRTNIQKDYNAGRALEFQSDQPVALEFIGIEDSRQTDICKMRTGTILPYTDPWWDDNWPPLHYNCRSTVRGISAEEAEVSGLLPELNRMKSTSKAWMANAATAQKGFGKNPAKDNQFWKTSPSQQARIVNALIQEEINGVVGQTVAKDFDRDIPGYAHVRTSKGGVRYPVEMERDSEFVGNLDMAKTLADKEGYYVELRKNQLLPGNRQWDAWLNGMEKIEFKDLVSDKAGTLGMELRTAMEQASSLCVRLHKTSQVKKFSIAVGNSVDLLKATGRPLSQVKVIMGDKMVSLAGKALTDPTLRMEVLTALY